MENALVSLICIIMLVFGMVTIVSSSLNSFDTIADDWKQAEAQARAIRATDITSVSSETHEDGESVEIVIRNDGREALAYFEKWDVIVRYQDGTAKWIPYDISTPGWTVEGIYLGGGPEIFEPAIFNPMESMKIIINLDPPVAKQTTNLASISTPNGISTQITFGWN